MGAVTKDIYQEQRMIDKVQRTEDRGQRIEDRKEDRGQRTEDRGQRTEDRGQRTEDGSNLGSKYKGCIKRKGEKETILTGCLWDMVFFPFPEC